MSQNSSSPAEVVNEVAQPAVRRKWWMLVVLPLWVFISFFAAQFLVVGLEKVLNALHVPLGALNGSVLNTVFAVVLYAVTLVIVIGVPWLALKKRVSRTEIGLFRYPSWTDIAMTPVAAVVYFILSAILVYVATTFLPWFDASQVQNTGFGQLNQRYEYILAFVTLVVIAPIAEETLFRGYLFGKLLKFVPAWAAILATSLLFAAIHGAWNVAVDTFALSVVLCLLRLSTGSLWAPILLHMTKNGIAYYLLFINPLFLHTLGG